jgi:hypothetical protein
MDIVYATTTAYIPLTDGGRILVRAGSHWPADDPVVVAQPSIFSADPRYGLSFTAEPIDEKRAPEPPIEQATAAPGEKRTADPRSMRRAV